MSSEMDLALFVYGSLMPGESNWKRYCEHRVVELMPARVRGRIYKCSDGYLALAQQESQISNFKSKIPKHEHPEPGHTKPETLPWARGWRLVLHNADALRNIDRLEGYDPAHPLEENLYLRERIQCFADDKSDSPLPLGEAWAYTMTPVRLALEGGVELPSS